jgi:2-hydroxychromene-2-carboxylate isomerase
MTSDKTIDFYWETGSTNTYFALHLIRPIAERHDATIVYHPFNLGHVFRKHNYVLMEEPKVKIDNRIRDLQRWAERYDLPFLFPSNFPIKTSRTLRGALAMRRWDLEETFIDAIFAAYWERDDASIADYAGMGPLVERLGVDPSEFERVAESDEVRAELAKSTNDGLAKGIFGCPSFVVGGELYWGKDRMEFIEDALR